MRTFVAIKLPGEVKEEIVRAQDYFRSLSLDAKWVEFENIHITMKFLGEVKEEDIVKVKDVIAGLKDIVDSFGLTLSGAGGFPSVIRPRVLWVGIEPQDSPVKIIEYLEEKFEKINFPKEDRKPHPHITIARIKSSKNIHKVNQHIIPLQIKKIEWQVNEISLCRSILTSHGPIYEEIFVQLLK